LSKDEESRYKEIKQEIRDTPTADMYGSLLLFITLLLKTRKNINVINRIKKGTPKIIKIMFIIPP
jgi:hypothetical protein